MGRYGLCLSRVMGAIAEVYHDEKGIIWPSSISPYPAHLILISDKRKEEAEKIYQNLLKEGIEVLYDERQESAGVKLNDADLIGISLQLTLGDKNKDLIEYRLRDGSSQGVVQEKDIIKLIKNRYLVLTFDFFLHRRIRLWRRILT